jgi:hypothetical protein
VSDFQEYKSKPVTVLARKVEEPETVVTIHGLRSAVPGEYVLQVMGRQVQNVEQEDGSTKPEEVEYCRGFEVVDGDEFEAVYSATRKRKLPGDE